jgi:uncharacterized integral membrane protein (TIGR00698 family)
MDNYRDKFQGILSCVMVALAASFLSQNYSAPVMLFALLLGMSVNFLYENETCSEGIDYCASTILRVGVVLLGSRILFTDVLDLGWGTMLMVIAGVACTISFGALLARLLKLDYRFGMLSGGAVAICGISAAMTLSSVMPKNRDVEQYTLLTVVMVATFGAVAMVAYPVFADWLGLDVIEAGVFIGGSIHDVSHVVGASYAMSPEVSDVAMVVKMLRVALLIPVAWIFLAVFRRERAGGTDTGKIALPFFLVAFVVLVLINNLGLIPVTVAQLSDELSRACFVLAIVALGMKTSFKGLLTVGWRPMMLVLAESCFLGLLVLGWIML